MTTKMSHTTTAAAAALETALNSVKNGDAVEVAEMLIMLSAGFLRALCGDEYVRGFLESGLLDMDKPPVLKVHMVTKNTTGTKH